jgi:hypothetical protein
MALRLAQAKQKARDRRRRSLGRRLVIRSVMDSKT